MHFCRLNQWNSIAFFCKCMSAITFLCFVACLCIYICILLSLSKWNGIQANQPRQLCGQPASTLLTCRRANPSFLLLFNVFGVFLVVAVIGCCCCCFLSILFLLLLSLIHLASFGKCCWCYSCGCCYQCSLCQPSLKVVTTTTTGGSVLFPSQRTFLAPRTRTFGLFWPVLACLGYLSLIYALFGVLF